MGLLDKAGAASSPKEKPAAKAKAKAVAKAKPVEKAKAVAKAKPVEKAKAVAKAAKPVKEKKEKKEKKKRAPRPAGLPEGFELANKLDRTMSWFVNFGWNFGVLIAAIFMMFSDTNVVTTILLAVSFVMMLINVIILPIKTGRTLGQFVSRIKYVNSEGVKSNPIQGMLSNSAGIFSLFGLMAVMMNFQKLGDKAAGAGPIVWTVIGAIFLIMWIVNFQFSRASEYKQGIYDLMFGAYLVKHVPADGESSTGFWAKLENMGNYGDQFAARREAKKAEREQKAAEEAAKAEEESQKEDAESTPETKEEPKTKSKSKAKPKAKADK
ncbi:MAG: hypothetical protein CMA81_03980 [Euryarchaeota archaeon]|nr:hypothetical protein [Euryarchaeota archaeon]